LRPVGVLAELAAGASLTQQVPALVEHLLEVLEAVGIGSFGRASERVLLVHEGPYAIENAGVVHIGCFYPPRGPTVLATLGPWALPNANGAGDHDDMPSAEPRPPLQWLDRATCDRLLADEEVGRLAVIAGGAPVIFVVNYVMDGRDIIFRSDPGTKVDLGPRAKACFQIDSIDREHKTGWSVVANGRLDEVTKYDAERWDRVTGLPLAPWADGAKAHWMRFVPTYVSGRRVG